MRKTTLLKRNRFTSPYVNESFNVNVNRNFRRSTHRRRFSCFSTIPQCGSSYAYARIRVRDAMTDKKYVARGSPPLPF